MNKKEWIETHKDSIRGFSPRENKILLGWLEYVPCTTNFKGLSLETAKACSEKWFSNSGDVGSQTELFKINEDYSLFSLNNSLAIMWEGDQMSHCLSSGNFNVVKDGIISRIFSIRCTTKNNTPICTIEMRGDEIAQIKGKRNTELSVKYFSLIKASLDFLGKNLGTNDLQLMGYSSFSEAEISLLKEVIYPVKEIDFQKSKLVFSMTEFRIINKRKLIDVINDNKPLKDKLFYLISPDCNFKLVKYLFDNNLLNEENKNRLLLRIILNCTYSGRRKILKKVLNFSNDWSLAEESAETQIACLVNLVQDNDFKRIKFDAEKIFNSIFRNDFLYNIKNKKKMEMFNFFINSFIEINNKYDARNARVEVLSDFVLFEGLEPEMIEKLFSSNLFDFIPSRQNFYKNILNELHENNEIENILLVLDNFRDGLFIDFYILRNEKLLFNLIMELHRKLKNKSNKKYKSLRKNLNKFTTIEMRIGLLFERLFKKNRVGIL